MSPPPQSESLSLAGPWRVCLDGNLATDGVPPAAAFSAAITLPGTTETAGIGPLNPNHRPDRLTAVHRIEVPVWFAREIAIPEAWAGRPVRLFVERTKWCRVWLDGRALADEPLLCVPHETALGIVTPGQHQLVLLVDNRRVPAPGDNHQVSEHTQGNWSGLLGAIELRATGLQWIDQVTVLPDIAARELKLNVRIGRLVGTPVTGTLTVAAGAAAVSCPAAEVVDLVLPLGQDATLWDEFSPALHRLQITLASAHGTEERTITTGLREFRRAGTQFSVNGRAVFLRGEVNCCVFPLTGHPPLDVAGWRDYFSILRAHGLNHVRFHSWTPPDAAFTAADELGFYVQTELPFWGEWTPAIAAALAPEAEAILLTYGHHPSFVLLSLGNEHRGDRAARAALVEKLRDLDPHRLFVQGANNDLAAPSLAPDDDCWITARLPADGSPSRYVNVRGSHATPDRADGHVQIGPGGTRTDYRAAIAGLALPVISHEIGQYSSYPRFEEISRYAGVFAAHNLAQMRDRAIAAGLSGRAGRFATASTALAALCYREEIEAALRTPGFGGFQLLGLQDFPGQGTALVGLHDAFLADKGAVSQGVFRTFCGPLVLLARFDRHTWVSGETFAADLELAHYGPVDFGAGELKWSLETGGSTLANGVLPTGPVVRGGLHPLAALEIKLPEVSRATALSFNLWHDTSRVTATYPLWVYPPSTPATPANVVVASAFDDQACAALTAGRTVVLFAGAGRPLRNSPGGGWAPDFWCWTMFKNVPGTLGLAISADHPALAGFPTENHSNWQWFHLARAAQPVVLDELDSRLVPIVEVIDNPERAHRLGLIFEARVGAGRLLVCAIDLPALAHRHPEARALRDSLLHYAGSAPHGPLVSLPSEVLGRALAV